jgi:hypothetical protein
MSRRARTKLSARELAEEIVLRVMAESGDGRLCRTLFDSVIRPALKSSGDLPRVV